MFDSGINVVSPCYVLSLCGQNRQGRRTASGSRFPRPTQGADTAPYFHFHTALFRPNFQKSNTYFVRVPFSDIQATCMGAPNLKCPPLNRFGNGFSDISSEVRPAPSFTERSEASQIPLRGRTCFLNRRRIVMLIGRKRFPLFAAAAPRADEVMHLDRRTVTMSFSGLRPIFAIGGCGSGFAALTNRAILWCSGVMGLRRAARTLWSPGMVLRIRVAALMSRAGRSLRTRRPATRCRSVWRARRRLRTRLCRSK